MSSGMDTTNMTKEELIRVLQTLQNRVTELESCQSTYREQKQLFETMFRSAPIGLYIVQDGYFAVVGNEFLRITGHSENELIEKPSLSLVVSEDRDIVRENAIMMLKGKRTSGYEFRITTKSGEIRDIFETVTSIQYRGKRAVLSNFMDITGHVKALQALRASEHNFRNSVETSPLGMRIADTEGNFIYANKALLDLWGYSSIDELKETPQEKLYTTISYKKQLERRRERRLGKSVPTPYKVDIVRKDNEIRHLIVLRNETLWEGRKHLQFIYQDITERRMAEEKYKTMLQTARDGFCITSREGKLLEVNDSYCKITGYTREELLEMSVMDIEAVEAPDETHRHLEEMARSGSDRFETRYRRKDGRIIDVEVSVNYIDTDGGQMFVFLRNITRRKKVLEEIRKLNYAIEQSNDGIVIYDLNNVITYANQAYARMHGFPHEEIIGMSLAKVHRDDDLTRLMLKKTRNGLTHKEREHFSADGTSFPVYTSVTVLTNSEGVPMGMLAIDRDITELKQTEEALQKSEGTLRAIGESIPDVTIILDSDGRYVDILTGEKELLFMEKEKIIGQRLHDVLPKEIADAGLEAIHTAINHNETQTIEYQLNVPAGDRWFEGRVSPIQSTNHKNKLVVMVSRDITERKRFEDELRRVEKLESIGTLAGGIAHDFNNLLTAIMGNIGLAIRHAENGKDVTDRLLEAEKASQRARDLTGQGMNRVHYLQNFAGTWFTD